MTHLNTPLKLITSHSKLVDLCKRLLSFPTVAVDTESNSLFAYREQVCLIQFSTPEKDYLVDPLAIGDISPLEEVFASEQTEKIFHAAEYDLLTMTRDFEFNFCNLFDTMLAARIAGRKKIGLGTLLAEEFDVQVEKKYQRADWGKRPLPPEMQLYARLDTHYLIRLRNLLDQELSKLGRRELAQDDFVRLCFVNGTVPEPHGVDVWRINGVRSLSPQQVTILRYLAEYREDAAQKQDRPLFKVIGDRTLVAVAEAQPKNLNELSQMPGMSQRQVRRYGKAMLHAVRKAEGDKPSYRKRPPAIDEKVLTLIEILREWRKVTARSQGVESDVVLPRQLLEKIAHQQPVSRVQLDEILTESPWRKKHYSERIWSEIEKVLPS
ncbi:MAG: ribonuclease D [Chloroflexota bacterium]